MQRRETMITPSNIVRRRVTNRLYTFSKRNEKFRIRGNVRVSKRVGAGGWSGGESAKALLVTGKGRWSGGGGRGGGVLDEDIPGRNE